MKLIQFFFVLFLFNCSKTENLPQKYNLTIEKGYGSGLYSVGDTVHIWSEAVSENSIFQAWTGETSALKSPKEWHTTLVMPAKDLKLTANFQAMQVNFINEQMQGVQKSKNVNYYFPQNLKGVIYLFHGSGGKGDNWIRGVEYLQFTLSAVAAGFGIICTDAEELRTTAGDPDAKLRWQTAPVDVAQNIDIANIKKLNDTFINRGNFAKNTPLYAVGMSNGGGFTASIASALNFRAAVSYCAQHSPTIIDQTNVPIAYSMAKYDDFPQVNNNSAEDNFNKLKARKICTQFNVNDKSPLYPERMARIKGISLASSQAIFNDLKNNGILGEKNEVKFSTSEIASKYSADPSKFPAIFALLPSQQLAMLDQLDVCRATHKFYSDFNQTTLSFFISLCQ